MTCPARLTRRRRLTTIHQPLYDIGRIATEALLGLINGEAVQAAIPPLELIVRETTRRIR